MSGSSTSIGPRATRTATSSKPLDLDRGNGCLVYDVPNRGNQPIVPRLNGAPDGGHPQHAGNGFLMWRGFTVVWSGWQGDMPPGADRLTARFPIISTRRVRGAAAPGPTRNR